jgi:preprotein translocase subunit SecD
MRSRVGWALVGILALAIMVIYIDLPKTPGIHLLGYDNSLKISEGLDLQGGIQFLLQAKCPNTDLKCDIAASLPATLQNIKTRVSGGLGVNEAVVTSQRDATSGNYYISVQLPGLKDASQALSLIGTTGDLEFIDTQGQALPLGTAVTPGQYKVVFKGSQLDPSSIGVSLDQTGKPQITFEFNSATRSAFANYTQQNTGQYLTITLDGTVIESAVIQSQITGQGEISGSMTVDQANSTAQVLKYGSLPLPLTLSSQRSIDATLGAQAIDYSLRAALIGLGLVIIFMLIFYRLPGLVATLALALFAGLLIAIIKFLGVVLTLAGIAGVVLTIGMAVDANILIFERVKEELRGGRTLAAAIDIGWKRAWPSIRDSNASTIITCLILIYVGSNFGATIIVGFATNLLIGVLVSLFTAVVVTRTLLNLIVAIPRVATSAWLFALPKEAFTVPTYRRGGRSAGTSRAPAAALAGAGAVDLGADDVEE